MTAINNNNKDSIRQIALTRFLQLCQINTYPAKTILIHSGKINENLYYIVNGSVAVVADDTDGKDLILAYLNKGEFIGEIGVFTGKEIRVVNVKTRCECKIAQITHEQLKQDLKSELPEQSAEILFMLGEQMAKRLLTTNRNFRDLAFMDTRGRIVRTLLDLCKQPDAMTHPDGMQIYISRQEIGKIAGCSREVVGRVLKELEDDKLITAHGKTIVVFGTR